MPKYVIERDLPGAGKLDAAELQGISQKSCSVLSELGPQIEALVREHAQKGGFPANKVSQVRATIDPTTSE